MSSNDKYFALGLVGVVAIFGSVVLELAQAAAPVPQEVVHLERVVIIGKRAPVEVQLPTVIVEGRRSYAAGDGQVVAAKAPAKTV